MQICAVPACSPYAVFRAEDWLPTPLSPSGQPSPASQRRAPTPAMATGAGARWATLVQGDLFQPLALDCATPARADRGPTAR
jgi:hypothetical protein